MKTRPIVPTLDELQALLNVEHPGDLPDAVRELQEQNAAYQRGIEATKQLLDKLNELIILDKIEQMFRRQS
jgi:hypothetical protein